MDACRSCIAGRTTRLCMSQLGQPLRSCVDPASEVHAVIDGPGPPHLARAVARPFQSKSWASCQMAYRVNAECGMWPSTSAVSMLQLIKSAAVGDVSHVVGVRSTRCGKVVWRLPDAVIFTAAMYGCRTGSNGFTNRVRATPPGAGARRRASCPCHARGRRRSRRRTFRTACFPRRRAEK